MPLHLEIRHRWDLSPREAAELQRELRARVEARDRLDPVERVAGVDVGFEDGGATVRAAVAVLAFPSLEIVETAIARVPASFPYVPGLLSFRELPGVLAALERLARLPDLILYDGQGLAHPRRFGIACHLGVLTDIPTIGVAKTRLIGEHRVLRPERGTWVPLTEGGETIGAVLRTRGAVAPVYVSVGHRIGLETAIRWVLDCSPRYRLPETTRRAHRLASGPAP